MPWDHCGIVVLPRLGDNVFSNVVNLDNLRNVHD
jgi:hypothetical protein